MSILGEYVNGNHHVQIHSDGTKIRENDLDFFDPAFPESFDIKITNQCDMGCLMCHEDSRPDGKHGDILHLPFLGSIHPYTELAIGGGNPLAHPDLVPFLRICKDHDLKILILGYKDFRRGARNYNAHWREVEDKKIWLHDRLGGAIKNGEFKAISFDNIGLGQLSPGRFMTKEEWEEFYMGDDGRNGSFNSASMYIDAVDGKFAYNSCCPMRYDNTCLSLYRLLRHPPARLL